MLSSSLQFGSTTIEYDVSFTRRKTVAIEVHPDQQVTIIAPDGSDPAAIEALLYKRAGWIVRQQQYFSAYPSPEIPRTYVSGESYRYLGRQYRLKVIEGQIEGVKHERGFIYVTVVAKSDTKHIQSVLEQWYRDEARRVFYERLSVCYPRIERLEIPSPPLAIRSMRTRWGSCSRSGLVTLNPKLVQTPRDCIDCVLIHGLCHLKEHNHSKRYYQLLDQTLPDWRERREKLNKFEC